MESHNKMRVSCDELFRYSVIPYSAFYKLPKYDDCKLREQRNVMIEIIFTYREYYILL